MDDFIWYIIYSSNLDQPRNVFLATLLAITIVAKDQTAGTTVWVSLEDPKPLSSASQNHPHLYSDDFVMTSFELLMTETFRGFFSALLKVKWAIETHVYRIVCYQTL